MLDSMQTLGQMSRIGTLLFGAMSGQPAAPPSSAAPAPAQDAASVLASALAGGGLASQQPPSHQSIPQNSKVAEVVQRLLRFAQEETEPQPQNLNLEEQPAFKKIAERSFCAARHGERARCKT